MPIVFEDYQKKREDFWQTIWAKHGSKQYFGRYYHKLLLRYYQFIIQPNSTILEVGCGDGKLIGNISAKSKTGIDLSSNAISLGESRYHEVQFINQDIFKKEYY